MKKLAAILALAGAAFAQHSTDPAAPAAKTAEQAYKNITELKGTPADQLIPAMQFMASALGVNCEFCHVQGKFEADDKNAKKTARAMIAMQNMINTNAFHGQKQISCYSCHRGAQRPVAVPPVLESDAAITPGTPTVGAPAAAGAPTVDQILEKYVTAVGGADAMRKVTSRAMKGTQIAGGNQTPIEVLTKAP